MSHTRFRMVAALRRQLEASLINVSPVPASLKVNSVAEFDTIRHELAHETGDEGPEHDFHK